jgi:preprotein translocase subunit Sec63
MVTITITVICFAGGFIIVSYGSRATAEWMKRRKTRVGAGREDYYRRVLGVQQGASLEDLTSAYQHRVLKYDPEKFREFGPEFEDLARERTRDIDEAYAYLGQRGRYIMVHYQT